MPMRYSLSVTYVQSDEMVDVARALERAGFFALTMGDHPVHPVEIAPTYPYDAQGRSSVTARTPQLDPWVSAGAVAAATENLHYMTTVYLALFRHPLLTAKAASTLAGISGGRFLFGVGLGWMREEYEAMGVPWARRGAHLDEVLGILTAMWAGGEVSHTGEFYRFPPIGTAPTPPARIPLYFGGHSEQMMARAATWGDGWICAGEPELAATQIATIDARRRALDRDHLPFEYVAMVPRIDRDAVAVLADAGVRHVLVRAPWRPDLGGPPARGPKPEIVEDMGARLAHVVRDLA
jgi:probable F420-dependent oxidoreductase